MTSLLNEANALLPQLQDLRRRLHSHPEVGLDLPHTQAAVLTALEGLDLEVSTGVGTTSVVAVLRGTHPDKPAQAPAVLLRGDMDALPVEELTEEPFKSTNGNMHACGHDLHTAGLVGAAALLHAHREDLAGDVVFMFQPGEEGHNGASVMINEGVLDAAGSQGRRLDEARDAAGRLQRPAHHPPRTWWPRVPTAVGDRPGPGLGRARHRAAEHGQSAYQHLRSDRPVRDPAEGR